MQIQLSLHIFGSLKGYTTLAKTADVTSVESTFLERFSFGQTTDQSYLDSLDTNPAFISRPLPSGRWAVTRVTKGHPDDYHRQTMLFTTAILTMTDWLDILHCNFMLLLPELRLIHLSPGEQLSKVIIDVPAKRPTPSVELREKIIPLLSAIEATESSGCNVILLNDINYNADILCWLNMLLPRQNRAVFSCASRSLSDGLDVDVISMARAASFGNSTRRPIQFSPAKVTDKSPFTQMVDHNWQERDMPPWQFIDKCPSFTFDKNISDFSTPTTPTFRPAGRQTVVKPIRHRKIPSVIIKIIFSLLIISILVTAGYLIKIKREKAKEIDNLLEVSKKFISDNNNLSDIATQELDGRISRCKQLINYIDSNVPLNDSRFKGAKEDLEGWLNNKASKRQMVSENIKDLLADCERTKLELPSIYPDRQQISRILDLKQRCDSCFKNSLEFKEDYKTELGKFIYQISKWQNKTEDLLRNLCQPNEIISKDILTLSAYKKSEVDRYNNIRGELNKLKNDESLKNALSSPIEEHSNEAKKHNANIDTKINIISVNIEQAEGFKKESSDMIGEVEKYLTDVNNVAADSNCVKKMKIIGDAKKYWPANPNIDEVSKRLLSAIISGAEKYLADVNSVSTDPNSYVKGLIKIEANVKDAKRYWPTKKVDEIDKKILDARNFSKQMEPIRKKFSEIEKYLADPNFTQKHSGPNCTQIFADPNSIQIFLDASQKINELKEPHLSKISKTRFIELFENWRKMYEIGGNVVSISCDRTKSSDPNDDKQSYEYVCKILNCLKQKQ